MSFNHNDSDPQTGNSYYSSTSGSRGHKRPRNPRKHLDTCSNTSPSARLINCECDKLAQDQKHTNGMYIISVGFVHQSTSRTIVNFIPNEALIPLYRL